jgi:hypothetical protein
VLIRRNAYEIFVEVAMAEDLIPCRHELPPGVRLIPGDPVVRVSISHAASRLSEVQRILKLFCTDRRHCSNRASDRRLRRGSGNAPSPITGALHRTAAPLHPAAGGLLDASCTHRPLSIAGLTR